MVIVTTKSGVKGDSKITLDASWGVSNATRLPKMMDTKTYARALVDYAGKSEAELKDFLDGTNPGIDWADQMFRTGVTQNYKVVFNKGTEGMPSYVSGNYMKHEGTIKESSYEHYSAKVNIKTSLKKWLDVTLGLNASRGIGKGIGELSMSGYNPLWIAFSSSPAMNMYDENGNYVWDPYCTIQANAYGTIHDNKSERRHDVVNGHIDLKFNIAPGLTFTTSNGIDYFNNTSYSFSTQRVQESGNNGMGNNNAQRTMLQLTNNLTYIHSWGDHNLTATGVWDGLRVASQRSQDCRFPLQRAKPLHHHKLQGFQSCWLLVLKRLWRPCQRYRHRYLPYPTHVHVWRES